MKLTRRDFLKATAAVAAAFGLPGGAFLPRKEALALEAEDGGVPVVWLQAQTCSGCSVSLLNSIYYKTADDLLANSLDLQFHPTMMAAAGNLAVAAAEKAYRRGGYVLVVEGAIPTAAGGEYCYLWPGLTAQKGVDRYSKRAAFILAVGTCASYGGIPAGAPNPTGAQGLPATLAGKTVIKVPGCPSHPDWIVGTVAYLLANGTAPALDTRGRPTQFFGSTVHSQCRYRDGWEEVDTLGLQEGCLKEIGCKGPSTRGDCPIRKWNCPGAETVGVNWCIGAGAPCFGCTEPGFPDFMSPFYEFEDGGD
jgi:NiFe hydrogenase small subunit HydA